MRDVTIRVSAGMTQTVGVNRRERGIAQKRKRQSEIAREARIRLGRVDHDAHDGAVPAREVGDAQLQTLQLGRTERSPVATVEDQEEGRAAKVCEPYLVSVVVLEREARRGSPDHGSAGGR